MRKTLISLVFLNFLIGGLTAQSTDKLELFFKLSDYFLKRHVYNGLVNYQYASGNAKEIELLYKTIGEVDLTNASREEQKAFYINAYNLLVIYQVTESYPLVRPLDKEGFFDNVRYAVNGEQLTLNELETDKMLRNFEDARFHFVLACAAMSCPKLYNLGYQPENVEQLLEERTRVALNDRNFIRVDQEKKEARISKIFEWYQSDFEQNGQSVLDFINKYRDEKIPSDYRIVHYEYDWTLNERKS